MEYRTLGPLTVSVIGYGCMGLSHANGKALEEDEAIKVLIEAYDAGYTMFDTAETYGFKDDPHHNEKLVGKAFKDMRDKVVIATKFGVSFDYTNEDHPELILDSSPETIRKSIEGSLERLQTEYIDLYYQHRIDPNVEPEVVAGVMKELYEEGKIKAWGISMANEEYLRRANAVFPVTCIQNVYSLLSHDESLFDTLEELHIGLVSCCPLAKGFLSGKYQKGETFEAGDYRNYTSWFKDESFDRNVKLMGVINKIADKYNASPAQVSLAWMTSKKPWIIPIPGSRKIARLKENAGAGNIHLTNEEIYEIDRLLED